MDYRIKKYYLVLVPYYFMNDFVLVIKNTIKSSKVHHYVSTSDISNYAAKVMISCNKNDSETLEGLLLSLQKITIKYFKKNTYLGAKEINRKCLRFKELTKEELGQ